MAFPKLFNYEKPGPGVSKNAPKKKRFFLFWELLFRKFWKLIQANFVFVLFSVPLILSVVGFCYALAIENRPLFWGSIVLFFPAMALVGLAEVGLSYITRNFSREKHAFVWSDFIGTIKKNWKQALPVMLINNLLELFLLFDVYFYAQLNIESSVTRVICTAIAMLMLLVFTFMRYYMPLLMITFKLSWKQLYKNALIFSMANVFPNLLITVLVVPFYLFFYAALSVPDYAFLSFLMVYFLMFFPAMRSFLIQFCIFPKVKKLMIDPYYKDRPQEDAAAKRALNLEVEESADREDAVFVDRGRTDSYAGDTDPKDLPPIPKQYSEDEMRRLRRQHRREAAGDEDDTI